MSGLRRVPARKLMGVLVGLGFTATTQRGSHLKLHHSDGRTIVVPVHPGRDVKVGLLRAILRQVGLDVEEFQRPL